MLLDENANTRGKSRTAELVQADKKTAVAHITTCYNQGLQNNISKQTTHQTLMQMSYNCRGKAQRAAESQIRHACPV